MRMEAFYAMLQGIGNLYAPRYSQGGTPQSRDAPRGKHSRTRAQDRRMAKKRINVLRNRRAHR